MGFFMQRKIQLFMTVTLLICAVLLARESAIYVQNTRTVSDSSFCIVVDAGHGGKDPGKVGTNGALEKDINLSIALLLAEKLKEHQIPVVLTRTEDVDLSENATKNFKIADLQNRCRFITETNPVFTISIHQNSYPSAEISGAQVFYYTHSAEGEDLANIIQSSLVTNVDPTNRRCAKANDSYYLLKKTPTPTIIVECGFLSNPKEAEQLSTPEYQKQLVNAIFLGITAYLESNDYS